MGNLSKSSPFPGDRFLPKDLDCIMFHLKRKVTGRRFKRDNAIPEIALNKFSPWEVREMSYPKNRDPEGFFFYSAGQRKERSCKGGFWKLTANGKPILNKSHMVGRRKTLTFYRGKAPGSITDWHIHEYSLEDKELPVASNYQNRFVLCKIFENKSRGPKIDEGYESPEEEDDDSVNGDNENGSSVPFLPAIPSSSHGPEESQNAVVTMSALNFGNGQDAALPVPPHSATTIVPHCHFSYPEHDIHKFLLNVPDEDGNTLIHNRSDKSGSHHQVDSVPNRSTIEDGDAHVINYESNLIKQLGEENVWQHCPSPGSTTGFLEEVDLSNPMEDEGAYFEWNDLLIPMEADVSNHWTLDSSLAHNVQPVLPSPEAIVGSENIWGLQERTCDYAASPLEAEGTVIKYAPQSLAGGKQLKMYLGIGMHLARRVVPDTCAIPPGFYRCLSCFSYSLEDDSCRVSCGCSCSIIVEDEVTIIHAKDGLLGISRGFPFWSYFELAEILEAVVLFLVYVYFKSCVSLSMCSLCFQNWEASMAAPLQHCCDSISFHFMHVLC